MKDEYRKKYLKIRQNIKNKKQKDLSIYKQVIDNQNIKKANLILIYVSKENEIDTLKLITYFLKHKKVAVPKIINNNMEFYLINSLKELKKGYFNVPEPTSNNIVIDYTKSVSITPGICYSKDLYRLGYGKGFYDKFYQEHKDIYKIGLCYQELLLTEIPHNNHDIQVDEIISDKTD